MADRSVSWTDAERVALLLKQVSSPKGTPSRGYASRNTTSTAAAALTGGNGRATAPAAAALNPLTAPSLAPPGIALAPPGAASATAPKANAPGSGANIPNASLTHSSVPAPVGGSASRPASAAPTRTEPLPAAPLPAAPLPAREFAPSQPKPEAVSAVPRLQQTSDNPSDRLDALVAWTLDHHRCNGAFVADDNGLTLAAHGISEAHVSLVGPLFSAMVGIRSIPGIDGTAGALWLGANMMSWVEARNERGGFCLGAVGPEPLSTQALEQLKEALELTVRGL